MSEYQYYEFRAIDRPLNPKQMAELRAISTRAEITPTSFTNTYHWGDFKGEPEVLMERYFDAFVYVANWGTRQLMFRIPADFLDAKTAEMFCDDETLSIKSANRHLVLEFLSDSEAGDWNEEGDQWMPSLILLRDDLLRGDLRALYIGWLGSLRFREADGDEEENNQLEPPVPPGLNKLSAPLKELATFLRVEDELIEAAASASKGEPPAGPSHADMVQWIKTLPSAEKDAYLARFLAEEGDIFLRPELLKRFREAFIPKRAKPDVKPRTIGELLTARDALVEEKSRKEAENAAKTKARVEREQAEARTRYLDALSHREPAAWDEVETLIATKIPKNYDQAVTLLADLRELAERSGHAAEADARIRELRQNHAKKPSLIARLDQKQLG